MGFIKDEIGPWTCGPTKCGLYWWTSINYDGRKGGPQFMIGGPTFPRWTRPPHPSSLDRYSSQPPKLSFTAEVDWTTSIDWTASVSVRGDLERRPRWNGARIEMNINWNDRRVGLDGLGGPKSRGEMGNRAVRSVLLFPCIFHLHFTIWNRPAQTSPAVYPFPLLILNLHGNPALYPPCTLHLHPAFYPLPENYNFPKGFYTKVEGLFPSGG